MKYAVYYARLVNIMDDSEIIYKIGRKNNIVNRLPAICNGGHNYKDWIAYLVRIDYYETLYAAARAETKVKNKYKQHTYKECQFPTECFEFDVLGDDYGQVLARATKSGFAWIEET